MPGTWIDFKELRAKLKFEDVLRHYGVEIKRKGSQHHGFCPLPNHNGKKNSPSFSANLDRGLFHCFGCGAKGNLLEFAALMEKVSVDDGRALRGVAVKLQKQLCPDLVSSRPWQGQDKEDTPPKPESKELPVVVNAPLDFELKGLERDHSYLTGRGFSKETIAHFGLGFCSRGHFKDRIVIPLQDHEGKLVGYAGRVVDDALIGEDNPRYRFPSKRERSGTHFEFRKTLFLYNGFRIKAPCNDLCVVEGFTSAWWLHQHGFPSVVATMGAEASERQAALIVSLVKPFGRVWFLSDGDKAGERFAESLLREVSPHRFVRWVKPVEGQQPTDLSAEKLKACFTM